MLLVSHRLQQGLHPLNSLSVYMHSREWGLLCSLTCSCMQRVGDNQSMLHVQGALLVELHTLSIEGAHR